MLHHASHFFINNAGKPCQDCLSSDTPEDRLFANQANQGVLSLLQ